jgi:hypothetical protein
VKHPTSYSIAALIACLAVSSCGGSQRAPASPAQPVTAAPEQNTNDTMVSAPAAGAAPAPAPPAEAEGPSSTKARERAPLTEIETWDKQLDGALTLSTPDCNTSWALRDRICDLAQRLCDLAARSAEPEVADRCTDGRARCERATTRVRAACPE